MLQAVFKPRSATLVISVVPVSHALGERDDCDVQLPGTACRDDQGQSDGADLRVRNVERVQCLSGANRHRNDKQPIVFCTTLAMSISV